MAAPAKETSLLLSFSYLRGKWGRLHSWRQHRSQGVFSSEEEALDAAWQDAATQVKSIQQLSDEAWAPLSLEEQCRLVRLLGYEDLGPVMPEKQCCVECGLPTSVDDDGLCNACSAKLG